MLREQRQSIPEAGREAWMRPTTAYQGEGMRVDGGLLREARTGLEAALQQLNRISYCTAKQEEGWEVATQVTDDDSVRVGRFLHGRREVKSPEDSFIEAWPQEDAKKPEDSWSDCGAQPHERERKDSACGVSQSKGLRPEAIATISAITEQPPKLTTHVYSDAPSTPTEIILDPKKDLDWFRYSYFIQNNQLDFDDLAELVTRSTDERLDEDIGREAVFGEWDNAAFLAREQAHAHRPQTTGSDSHLRRSKSLEVHAQMQRRGSEDQTTKRPPTSACPRNLGQTQDHAWIPKVDVAHSCFSSDSSMNSVDWPCKFKSSADKPKAPATRWWKPKWKREGIHPVPAGVTPLSSPKENTFSLWKRMSKVTPRRTMDKELRIKVERELQHKLSLLSFERDSPRASDVGRQPGNVNSHLHPAFRNRHNPPTRPEPPCPCRTSGATRTSYQSNSEGNTASRAKNSQRGNTATARSEHWGSSTPRLSKAAPRIVHRPYKSSPLNIVSQVPSLDINKGLPRLPPEARQVTHQASRVTIKEVAGVRRVAIRKVSNEGVDEMAQLY